MQLNFTIFDVFQLLPRNVIILFFKLKRVSISVFIYDFKLSEVIHDIGQELAFAKFIRTIETFGNF